MLGQGPMSSARLTGALRGCVVGCYSRVSERDSHSSCHRVGGSHLQLGQSATMPVAVTHDGGNEEEARAARKAAKKAAKKAMREAEETEEKVSSPHLPPETPPL